MRSNRKTQGSDFAVLAGRHQPTSEATLRKNAPEAYICEGGRTAFLNLVTDSTNKK